MAKKFVLRSINLVNKTTLHFLVLASLVVSGISTSFAQTVTQPVAPSQLCIDDACPPSASTPSARSMKWNPGYYVTYVPSYFLTSNHKGLNPTPLAQLLSFMDSIKNEPIKGIQIYTYWGELEGKTAGDYTAGFKTMDAILARAAANGQHVMLHAWVSHYGGYPSDWTVFFPAYLIQPSKGGTDSADIYGIAEQNIADYSLGLQAKIWEKPTSDRYIALLRAYGVRYDSHPNFEMIMLYETSTNMKEGTYGYSRNALDTEFKRHMTAARAAFPTTGIRLGASYHFNDAMLISLIDHARKERIAIGGPDVSPKDVNPGNQVFTGATPGSKDYRGVIPFVAEVSEPELGGRVGTFTNRAIYRSVMYGEATSSNSRVDNDLGTGLFRATQPQYFVWQYQTWSGGPEQKWPTGTLPFIRSINGAVYSVACPSGYTDGCKK